MSSVHQSPRMLKPRHPGNAQLSANEMTLLKNHVLRGGLLGLPTETVYGLAARIDQENTLHQIFALKNRPFFDPLIVHCASLDQATPLIRADAPLLRTLQLLHRKFWPGPLTVVLPSSERIHPVINNGTHTVGVRIPRHPIALQILSELGPMAAPSANQFGRTSPTSAEHVVDSFTGVSQSDSILVIDGGPCEVGLESTVIQLQSPTEALLLRPGGIGAKEIVECLEIPVRALARTTKLTSPGMLDTHYQPKLPLYTFQKPDRIPSISEALAELKRNRTIDSNWTEKDIFWIQLHENPTVAARELYAVIRSADRSEAKAMGLILPSQAITEKNELWIAIADRLNRARTAHPQ